MRNIDRPDALSVILWPRDHVISQPEIMQTELSPLSPWSLTYKCTHLTHSDNRLSSSNLKFKRNETKQNQKANEKK